MDTTIRTATQQQPNSSSSSTRKIRHNTMCVTKRYILSRNVTFCLRNAIYIWSRFVHETPYLVTKRHIFVTKRHTVSRNVTYLSRKGHIFFLRNVPALFFASYLSLGGGQHPRKPRRCQIQRAAVQQQDHPARRPWLPGGEGVPTPFRLRKVSTTNLGGVRGMLRMMYMI